MYDYNKKQFIIRVDIITIWIMTLKEIKSGKIIKINQNKNRE